MTGTLRVGGSLRARDLAMGMLLACTSLVANAVVTGGGSLASRVTALPEPFTVQDAATGPQRGGATVVVATALASSTRSLTGSGLVPDTGTGQPDDGSPGHTDDSVAPAGAALVEPVENPVAVPPDASPGSEPVTVPGDEPEGPMAPILQPVTELLAPTEVTEPALAMLNPPLFA